MTARPYDQDRWLKFGYINQSRRQHCPPNMETARKRSAPGIKAHPGQRTFSMFKLITLKALTLTSHCVAYECSRRQNPLIVQDKPQWPTYPDQGNYKESKDREHQGHCDECLHHHEPYWQQPLSYNVIFLWKYMMAAIKLFVKLIVGITELLEAVFPESHVLEVAERLLIRLYPIRTGKIIENQYRCSSS